MTGHSSGVARTDAFLDWGRSRGPWRTARPECAADSRCRASALPVTFQCAVCSTLWLYLRSFESHTRFPPKLLGAPPTAPAPGNPWVASPEYHRLASDERQPRNRSEPPPSPSSSWAPRSSEVHGLASVPWAIGQGDCAALTLAASLALAAQGSSILRRRDPPARLSSENRWSSRFRPDLTCAEGRRRPSADPTRPDGSLLERGSEASEVRPPSSGLRFSPWRAAGSRPSNRGKTYIAPTSARPGPSEANRCRRGTDPRSRPVKP